MTKLVTVADLSRSTGRDRKAITRALGKITPARTRKRGDREEKLYRQAEALAAIGELQRLTELRDDIARVRAAITHKQLGLKEGTLVSAEDFNADLVRRFANAHQMLDRIRGRYYEIARHLHAGDIEAARQIVRDGITAAANEFTNPAE